MNRRGQRFLIILFMMFINLVRLTSSSLSVTTDTRQINQINDYKWQILSLDTNTRSSIAIYFASTQQVNLETISAIKMTGQDSTLNYTIDSQNYTVSSNISINIIIPQAIQNDTSFNIFVQDVKNGFRVRSIKPYIITNLNQRVNSSVSITFKSGTISGSNCDVGFQGQTWDTSGIMYINFTISNHIPAGEAEFFVDYPPTLAVNSANLSANGPTCSYMIKGVSSSFTGSTPVQELGDSRLACKFTTVQEIEDSSQIVLKLDDIVLPGSTTDYGDFKISTGDGSFDIDSMQTDTYCTNNQVDVLVYQGDFDQIKNINQDYTGPTVSISYTTPKIRQGDIIFVSYSGLTLLTCAVGDTLRFIRQDDLQSTLTVDSINSGSSLIKLVASLKDQDIGQTQIKFDSCGLKMPPSQTSYPIIFSFESSSNLLYMQIHAYLQAKAIQILDQDFSITLQDYQIGSNVTYQISLTTSAQLSNQFSIQVDFPSSIQFNDFAQQCDIQNSDSTIDVTNVTCFIKSETSKIIQIDVVTDSIGAIQSQTFEINIAGITNPQEPGQYSNFAVKTFYSTSDTQSMVQEGYNLESITYNKRVADISLGSDQIYTVNTYPSYFTFNYINIVPLDIGGFIQITVLDDLDFQSFFYSSAKVNEQTFSFTQTRNSTNSTITLKHNPSIPKFSEISIVFKFKTPIRVGFYDVINLRSYSKDGQDYQYSEFPLQLQIHTAAQQEFTISPIDGRTNVVSNYQISFSTYIDHNDKFNLEVNLPSDVTIQGKSECTSSGCTVLDDKEQQDGSKTIIIQLNYEIEGNYLIQITNLKNPSQVGQTGVFTFKTFSQDEQVLGGLSTAKITQPNQITGSLDSSFSYYRNNIDDVHITYKPNNTLEQDDYLLLNFDYRTYSLNPDSSLSCIYADCQLIISSSSMTLIKAVLTDTNNELVIIGLKSYGGNSYNQINIQIQSYSSTENLKDKGQIPYILSCNYNDDIKSKLCKTCHSNDTCDQCYTQEGFSIFNDDSCVNDCGTVSLYMSYEGSGVCQSCNDGNNKCQTCLEKDKCLSCADNYYLYQNQTCQDYCEQIGHYEASIGSRKICATCYSSECQYCKNGTSKGCQQCQSGYFLNDGDCTNSCGYGKYSNGTECVSCHESCDDCEQAGNSNCIDCAVGYLDINGTCLSSCPQGSVYMGGSCGCDSPCLTCETYSTFCLTCQSSQSVLYNGQCIQQCPDSSYKVNKQCIDCNSGCLNCSATSCLECLTGYNIYENKCYTQCNDIGDRYAAANGQCIKCPEGCDVCNQSYQCSICLTDYTLQNDTCILTCQINNDCQPIDPVPEQIIPLPGMIVTGVWLGLIIALKVFVVQGMYVPYSFVYMGCIIEITLIYIIVISQNNIISAITDQIVQRRLLVDVVVQDYQYGVIGLLSTGIALNYISNIIYIIFFCKYLKRYIADRQVDKIANYVVLVFGTLTNYRFSLLAYSKMFPKPKIEAENASNLTPLHYLCIGSIFVSIFPLIAVCVLIYNEYPLTDIFMLSVDLLIILIINILFSIWMVSTQKPDQYYQTTKKYKMQQTYKTQQNINQKDDIKNNSKTNLIGNNNNSVINVIDYSDEIDEIDLQKSMIKNENSLKIQPVTTKNRIQNDKSDIQNQPLPVIPVKNTNLNMENLRATQNNLSEEQNDLPNGTTAVLKQESSIITKRKQMNRKMKRSSTQHQQKNSKKAQQTQQNRLKSKNKESARNFSKEKVTNKKGIAADQSKKTKRPIQIQSQYIEEEQEQIPYSEPANKLQTKSGIIKKDKKSKIYTQRSEAHLPQNMKKKQSYGVFESDQNDSAIDQVDLDSIIQSKMIDKTNPNKNKLSKTLKTQNQVQYQEISPSWFNIANQRYDVDDQSSDI